MRAVIRGFRKIEKQNRLEYVAKLRNELANKTLSNKPLSTLFSDSKETCFHQFLVYRLINVDFNKALLIAIDHPKNHFFYPLPFQWRKILREHGFVLPPLVNNILWISFNIKWYFVGIITGLIEILNSTKFKKTKQTTKKTAFFENLYPNTLVQSKDISSQNILDWFSDQDEAKPIETILHNCKGIDNYKINDKSVCYKRTPYPTINSPFRLLQFTLWFTLQGFVSIFNFKQRLLFRELVFQKLTQLSAKSELNDFYFFHNSGHIFRPLWTYEAERKGSEIIFYFYSTNISSFKEKGKEFVQDFQWQVVSWSHYWVWNNQQLEFLNRNTIAKKKVTIKGIIPFTVSSSQKTLNYELDRDAILIFDVQPVKKYIYSSLAPTVDFYSEENTIRFLSWIDDLAQCFNLCVFIKRKRYSNQTSKLYLRKIEYLVNSGYWYDLDPAIDPNFACKQLGPLASISAPFTSTALISTKHNIPSIYLDSSKKLDKKFLINNGIPLISSKDELFNWFMKVNLDKSKKYKDIQ